jgi:hypothetical protein
MGIWEQKERHVQLLVSRAPLRPAILPRLTYPSRVGLEPTPSLTSIGHLARHHTQVICAALRRPASKNKAQSALIPSGEKRRLKAERTLSETFRVQRVATFPAEHQFVLINPMHALVADGTVVVGSRNAPLRVRRSGCRIFASRACISIANPVVGKSIWRLWRIRKYALELASEQSPTDYSSGQGQNAHNIPYFWYHNPEDCGT